MSPIFTQRQEATQPGEHPTEWARQALREAAVVETGPWANLMLRFAESLPSRAPLPVTGDAGS